jgi:hypothetical protein
MPISALIIPTPLTSSCLHNMVLLRGVFHIGLVIAPRPAVLV